ALCDIGQLVRGPRREPNSIQYRIRKRDFPSSRPPGPPFTKEPKVLIVQPRHSRATLDAEVPQFRQRSTLQVPTVACQSTDTVGRTPNLWVGKSARRSGFPKLFPATTELTAPQCDD